MKSLNKADLMTGPVTTFFPVPPTLFVVFMTTFRAHDSRLVGTSLESLGLVMMTGQCGHEINPSNVLVEPT